MISMKHITRTIPVISFCFALCFSIVLNAQSMRDDVLKYTNDLRRSQGLPALEMRDDLNELALKHSTSMAKGKTSFGHDGFEQRRVAASKTFPKLTGFAENVAYGPTTGKEVVTMWKNSSGHRRNMLGHYKFMGIGIAKDKQGRIFYTQVSAG